MPERLAWDARADNASRTSVDDPVTGTLNVKQPPALPGGDVISSPALPQRFDDLFATDARDSPADVPSAVANAERKRRL